MRKKIKANLKRTTEAWYKAKEAKHHIDEGGGSSMRIYLLVGALFHLFKFFPDTRSILDLGCGDGGLINLLADNFPDRKYRGIDINPDNIKFAQSRILKLFEVHPSVDIEVRTGNLITESGFSADVVILGDVLEHLHDPDSVLKKVHAKYVAISTPWNEPTKPNEVEHIWSWDRIGLENMVKAARYVPTFWFSAAVSPFVTIQFLLAKNRKLQKKEISLKKVTVITNK